MRLKSPDRLASIMQDRGLSHRRLAEALGRHHSFVDHLTAGRRSYCSPDAADAIVRTLNCTTADLFETGQGNR